MNILHDISAGEAERQRRLLAPFSSGAAVAALAAAAIIVILTASYFPEIDLAVSRTFFAGASCEPPHADPLALCGAFPAGSVGVLADLRQFLQALPLMIAIGLGLYLAASLVRGAGLRNASVMAGSAVFWTYVMSVGLLVNGLLKSYSGRPRPHQTTLFGGEFPFVPAGDFAGECARNCSFVSGEAAAAFWLICLVPLLPRGWRVPGFTAALAVALLTSAMRIAFGAHFLSDVLLAGLFTLLIFAVLATIAARISERAAASSQARAGAEPVGGSLPDGSTAPK